MIEEVKYLRREEDLIDIKEFASLIRNDVECFLKWVILIYLSFNAMCLKKLIRILRISIYSKIINQKGDELIKMWRLAKIKITNSSHTHYILKYRYGFNPLSNKF